MNTDCINGNIRLYTTIFLPITTITIFLYYFQFIVFRNNQNRITFKIFQFVLYQIISVTLHYSSKQIDNFRGTTVYLSARQRLFAHYFAVHNGRDALQKFLRTTSNRTVRNYLDHPLGFYMIQMIPKYHRIISKVFMDKCTDFWKVYDTTFFKTFTCFCVLLRCKPFWNLTSPRPPRLKIQRGILINKNFKKE